MLGARSRFTAVRTLALVSLAAGALALLSPEREARADDDRAVAQSLLTSGAALGPANVTGPATSEASDALERATRLRAAGDETHARIADGLAREWAETARDLASAAAAEKMAEDRKHQAIQARAQLQRTKALVEEGIARLGRLRAELDAASSPVRHAPSAATPGAVSPGAASARPVSLPPAAPVPAASPPAPGAPAPSTPVAPKSGAKP